MQFTSKVKVLGAKCFNDVVEGTRYDNTKIYVLTQMNEQQGTSVGFAAAEYQWGDSTNFQAIRHHQFPLDAEITIEMVTNGKTQKAVVTKLSVIPASKREG